MTLGGGAAGGLMIMLRHPTADVVSNGGAHEVARSLVLLGFALPVCLLLLFATCRAERVLARRSPMGPGRYAAAAAVNLVTVSILSDSSPDEAGAAASAIGICGSLAVLGTRFRGRVSRG